MRKLITAAQFKEADEFTINEGISSLNLMEKASQAFVKVFVQKFPDRRKSIKIYCGKGNNGGDGLAIARLLFDEGYFNQEIYIADFSEKASPDFTSNLQKLTDNGVEPFMLNANEDFDIQSSNIIIIDALFGSGLNKPLNTDFSDLINKINNTPAFKLAVDIPTGMPAEGDYFKTPIFKADLVISFQRPKLNFLLPESAPFIKAFKVVDIGISESFLEQSDTPYRWIWKGDFKEHYKQRSQFDYKGTFGHLLIIAGNSETTGAALLCTEAAINTGAGLTTVCLPDAGLTALNCRIPEAMFIARDNEIDLTKFNSLAIGPGLGKLTKERDILKFVLKFKGGLVLDADALNILAEDEKLLDSLPENTIITPHVKEFDRLFGEHVSWWQRIKTAQKEAKKRKIYIVLKNRYTITTSPEGVVYFNSSGTPAMAQGGMGDTLTGIIGALLAQKYSSLQAAIMGVYLHGRVAETCAQKMSVVSSTTLIKQIPYILKELST